MVVLEQFTSPRLFLDSEGRLGVTDDLTTSFLHFFSVLHCPLGLGELQACPFPDNAFPPLLLSALSSSSSHCALQVVLARPNERDTCPYHCSLRLFTIVRQVPTAYLPIHQRCIKCWLNILRMQEDRTPLKSYKMFLTCTVITKAIGPPLFALCCIDMVLDTFQCLKREIFVLI